MNRKAIILVTAVFVLGALLGGLGTYAWTADARANTGKRPDVVAKLTEILALSLAQQQQIQAVLNDTKGQFDATYSTIRPQMEAIRQAGRQKIRTILTPEQLPRFEEHLRQLDEERQRKSSK